MTFSLPFIEKLKERTRRHSISYRFLFLGILMMLISTTMTILAAVYVHNQYQTLYLQEQLQFEESVERSISKILEPRDKFLFDYTNWSDMAIAVGNKDVVKIQENMLGSLSNFETDKVWIFGKDMQLLHEESISPETNLPLSLDHNLINQLLFDKEGKIQNFGIYNGIPVRFIAKAIVFHTPNEKAEPAQGVMVLAKIWDEEITSEFESLTEATVTFTKQPEENPDNTFISYVKPLLVTDNTELGYLHFEKKINSLIFVRKSIFFILLLLTITGIPLIIFNYLFQKHVVLDPLSELIKNLKNSITSLPTYVQVTKNEIEILSEVTAAYISQKHLADYQNEKIKKTEASLEVAMKNQTTANHKLAEQLRTSIKLSKVVENSTNAVITTNDKGVIEYVNPAWEELNGYTFEEVKGKNPKMLKSGKTPEEIYDNMWKSLTKGKSFTSEEIINKRKDGTEYFCRLSVFPIVIGSETVNFVGIQQDISKQKEVDRMKTEFISLASHQLRTPLSAMRWFSELMMEDKVGKMTPKQTELLTALYQSTIRMIDLVNMLLDITRIESGRLSISPEKVELPKLIEEVLVEVTPAFQKKKQTIEKVFDKNLPTLQIDKKLIYEVFLNLLTNANKYTPEGGKIEIITEKQANDVLMKVKDNGFGIPKEVHPKIFSKFFRADNITKTETDGTGLGLYLIKLIVESSKGKIWFESEQGKGTTFLFTLPLKGTPAQKGEVQLS